MYTCLQGMSHTPSAHITDLGTYSVLASPRSRRDHLLQAGGSCLHHQYCCFHSCRDMNGFPISEPERQPVAKHCPLAGNCSFSVNALSCRSPLLYNMVQYPSISPLKLFLYSSSKATLQISVNTSRLFLPGFLHFSFKISLCSQSHGE